MNTERRSDTLLCSQQTGQITIDFTNLAVGARNSDAIAVCWLGSAANKMIAFVGSKHEQRVALIDAIMCQACKELPKSSIVGFELRYITRLARSKGATAHMIIMRVR